MSLELDHLDQRTRRYMLQEIEIDIGLGRLYLSPRLTGRGEADYPELLCNAASSGDDKTLARELDRHGRLKQTEHRHQPPGQVSVVEVPEIAVTTLAEGEFNRFYCRAVCRRAMDDGLGVVFVYRAKHVRAPRRESERMIGQEMDAAALLQDLRSHPGVEPALGLPPGPNSGLSVRLPSAASA